MVRVSDFKAVGRWFDPHSGVPSCVLVLSKFNADLKQNIKRQTRDKDNNKPTLH